MFAELASQARMSESAAEIAGTVYRFGNFED
jgi:hypothetical protein